MSNTVCCFFAAQSIFCSQPEGNTRQPQYLRLGLGQEFGFAQLWQLTQLVIFGHPPSSPQHLIDRNFVFSNQFALILIRGFYSTILNSFKVPSIYWNKAPSIESVFKIILKLESLVSLNFFNIEKLFLRFVWYKKGN